MAMALYKSMRSQKSDVQTCRYSLPYLPNSIILARVARGLNKFSFVR